LIPEFLAKAQENLQDAERALEEGRYNASANRAYYAAFQAAIAALTQENIIHEKNPHSWVQAQFSERLIKARKYYPAKLASHLLERLIKARKYYPAKLASHLLDMQKVRDKADYKPIMTNQQTAKKQIQQSREFLSYIFSRLQP
jgi:uncharacterized protein (UPF0332 family)